MISSKSVYVVPHSRSFFPRAVGFSGSFSSSSISNVASTASHNYLPRFPRFYLDGEQQLVRALRTGPEEAVPRGEGGELGGGAATVDAAIEGRENGALREATGALLALQRGGLRGQMLRLPGLGIGLIERVERGVA